MPRSFQVTTLCHDRFDEWHAADDVPEGVTGQYNFIMELRAAQQFALRDRPVLRTPLADELAHRIIYISGRRDGVSPFLRGKSDETGTYHLQPYKR
jgi:hypothetical protein